MQYKKKKEELHDIEKRTIGVENMALKQIQYLIKSESKNNGDVFMIPINPLMRQTRNLCIQNENGGNFLQKSHLRDF